MSDINNKLVNKALTNNHFDINLCTYLYILVACVLFTFYPAVRNQDEHQEILRNRIECKPIVS